MVPAFLLGLCVICNLKRDYQTLLATPFALLGLFDFLSLSGNGQLITEIRTYKDKGHMEIVPYRTTEKAELQKTD